MSDKTIDTDTVVESRKRAPEDCYDALNPEKLMKIDTSSAASSMAQKPRVQRYLIVLEYIGTHFAGTQRQPNCRTVQGVLEDAFKKFVGQSVSSVGSSRTDAGVHALMNAFHVDVERVSKRKPGEVLPSHEPEVVQRAVNHFLQRDGGDVSVVDVKKVPTCFHARFRAQERTYLYRIISGKDPVSVFQKDRAWHVPEELDLVQMQEACKILIGHHDFSSFRSSGCQAKSPVKTLDELNIYEISAWQDILPSMMNKGGEFDDNIQFGRKKKRNGYVVVARAQSFLYHQVRLLVGTLKFVGTGKISVEAVQRILRARTITETPPMAPACGLYLANVKYDFSCNCGSCGNNEQLY